MRGEKEARRVAQQFEEFRTAMPAFIPGLQMDMGKPVIILVAKNEGTMKALLPRYWEVKGNLHPAGIYVAGEDKNYVIVQADVAGENPYHVIYHEYTHAILHRNFRDLPRWLDEGFAELCGNTLIQSRKSIWASRTRTI